MKRIFLTLSLLPALSLPALAENESSPPVTIGSGGTEVIADDQTGTILFLIDGEVKAFLDKDGFHVRNNIEYGGTLADTGVVSFEKSINNIKGTEAGHNE